MYCPFMLQTRNSSPIELIPLKLTCRLSHTLWSCAGKSSRLPHAGQFLPFKSWGWFLIGPRFISGDLGPPVIALEIFIRLRRYREAQAHPTVLCWSALRLPLCVDGRTASSTNVYFSLSTKLDWCGFPFILTLSAVCHELVDRICFR